MEDFTLFLVCSVSTILKQIKSPACFTIERRKEEAFGSLLTSLSEMADRLLLIMKQNFKILTNRVPYNLTIVLLIFSVTED